MTAPPASPRGRAGGRLLWAGERLCALCLAYLLIRSEVTHTGNWYYFLDSVYSYQIVGPRTGEAAAAVLPFLQLVAAICLLTRFRLSEGYGLSFLLFAAFSSAQGIILSRGIKISCGCFGAAASQEVGRVTLLVALAGVACSTLGLVFAVAAGRAATRADASGSGRRPAFTLIELLVVIAILAVVIGLLLPAVQKVREAAARAKCQNNLKQIALALHHYHDANSGLPPGCSYRNGASPQPHMSWQTRLLPYVEQAALWEQALAAFRQEPFFLRGPHLAVIGRVIPTYSCPSDARTATPADLPEGLVGLTSYLGVAGTDHKKLNGVLFMDSQVRLTDITDGTSQTLVVGERPPSSAYNFGWWYAGWGQSKDGSADMLLGVRELKVPAIFSTCPAGPYEFTPGAFSGLCDTFHFWSPHPGGANFALADGSVRLMRYSANPIMPTLATRAGGEVVTVPE